MSKTTIIVLSDPAAGDEALGRVFNALAAAYDFKQQGREVQVVFHGAGTRWTGVLRDPEHPAHALFAAVEDCVLGASAGCSAVFGAREAAESGGFALIANNEVPGTPGLASVASFAAEGAVITF